MKLLAGGALAGFLIGVASHACDGVYGHWMTGPECLTDFCLTFILAIVIGTLLQRIESGARDMVVPLCAAVGLVAIWRSHFPYHLMAFEAGTRWDCLFLVFCPFIAALGLALTSGRSAGLGPRALAVGISGFGIAYWLHGTTVDMAQAISPFDTPRYIFLYYVIPTTILGLITSTAILLRRHLLPADADRSMRLPGIVFCALILLGFLLPLMRTGQP